LVCLSWSRKIKETDAIAVVTDSTADIPNDIVSQLGIHVIPAIVVIEGVPFLDGEGLSRPLFYEKLPSMSMPPTTAAPSSGYFEDLYTRLFDDGVTNIISIHVASQLSGLFNAARIGAQPFGSNVNVIDSGSLSMGLGYQVITAAETAVRGGSVEDIIGKIANIRKKTRLIAMIDTLEYLRRSGRVSFLRASMGAMMKTRLFVEIRDGEVIRLEQGRTRRKSLIRLGEILSNLSPLKELAILHSNSETDAREFFYNCNLSINILPLFINVTTVIGTHIGPNSIGFAAVCQ